MIRRVADLAPNRVWERPGSDCFIAVCANCRSMQ